jgi:carboxypeptidase D
MKFVALLTLAASTATTLATDFGRRSGPSHFNSKRQEAIQRLASSAHRDENGFIKRATSTGVKNITFTNPRASDFYVDGANLPEIDFDIGPSWAGLLPISDNANETRKLFFWLFPPGPEGSLDDLIFWYVKKIPSTINVGD